MDYFLHETSIVDKDCQIGKGTKIWHFSHIMSGSQIGEGCNIEYNPNVFNKSSISNGLSLK